MVHAQPIKAPGRDGKGARFAGQQGPLSKVAPHFQRVHLLAEPAANVVVRAFEHLGGSAQDEVQARAPGALSETNQSKGSWVK